MANHGSVIRRLIDRFGIDRVEELVDSKVFVARKSDRSPVAVRRASPGGRAKGRSPVAVEVPRLKAKEYMEDFINPEEYIEEQRKLITEGQQKKQGKCTGRAHARRARFSRLNTRHSKSGSVRC